MLVNELEAAITVARKAGAAVLEHYSSDIISENKIGLDNRSEPVTAADREASRIIVDGLSKLFPDDGVLSEEETDQMEERLSKVRVWMIDPIDGTAGFIKKDGDFAVQIGLAVDGGAVLGVVYMPARDILYYASKGDGSFAVEKSGSPRRLRVSAKTDFREMDIAVSRDHRSPKMSQMIRDLGLRKAVERGSVGVKVGLIAEQICDLYIHLSHRTKFWDTCGPEVIVTEAGGRLTDIFGNAMRYDLSNVQNLNGILASNGVSHASVVETLRPLLEEFGRLKLTTTVD